MKKEDQINEIAKDLCSRYKLCTCITRDGSCSEPQRHAGIIYELGYRKQAKAVWIGFESRCVEKLLTYDDWFCSRCRKIYPERHRNRLGDFCPHCGALMTEISFDPKK